MCFNKRGVILIASLWILTILAILAIGIGFRVSVEARLNKYNMDRVKGIYLAKAGIFKSQELLTRDGNPYDSIRECGITLVPGMSSPDEKDLLVNIFTEGLTDGKFTISYDEEGKNYSGMADEERKININMVPQSIPQPVLENLLMAGNGEVAASILNWRNVTQFPAGASDGYYESLPAPYRCKHTDFSVAEELMLVKGMTPELFESIKDYVTVYGDGKVNINTATKKVMRSFSLSEGIIDIIVTIRTGPDKIAGTEDDGIFIGDIAAQLGLPMDSPDRAIFGNYFTTSSNYFRIESKGQVNKSRVVSQIACVVKRGDKKLIYYREY